MSGKKVFTPLHTKYETIPDSFRIKITPKVGTIKPVALYSGVSHHLFESEDGGKREQDTRNSNNIYYQRAKIL